MRRPITLAMTLVGTASLGGAAMALGGGPLTVQAKSGASCSNCSPLFSQTVMGKSNTAKGEDSTFFTQTVGGPTTKDNSASITTSAGQLGTDSFILQDIGTFAGSNGSNDNSATMKGSSGGTGGAPGIDQVIGNPDPTNEGASNGNGVDVFDGFTGITLGASKNRESITNGGDDFDGCGPSAGNFCGQLIAGGNSNKLTWANGHGDSQQVFFFGSGGAANHNTESVIGSHVTQWITNATDPNFITVAQMGNGVVGNEPTTEPVAGSPLGSNASHNSLSYNGSNGTELVLNGSKNTETVNGNFDNISVTNGSSNKVTVEGNDDTVAIAGSSPSSTANDNTVKIEGSFDTVTITDTSHANEVIKGNDMTVNVP